MQRKRSVLGIALSTTKPPNIHSKTTTSRSKNISFIFSKLKKQRGSGGNGFPKSTDRRITTK